MWVGWMIERAEEGDDGADLVGRRQRAEHRFPKRFFNGSAEILLPAVPRPRRGSRNTVQARRQLGIAVGIIVERVEGQTTRVALDVTGIAAKPLIVRASGIVEQRLALPRQRRTLRPTQRNDPCHAAGADIDNLQSITQV